MWTWWTNQLPEVCLFLLVLGLEAWHTASHGFILLVRLPSHLLPGQLLLPHLLQLHLVLGLHVGPHAAIGGLAREGAWLPPADHSGAVVAPRLGELLLHPGSQFYVQTESCLTLSVPFFCEFSLKKIPLLPSGNLQPHFRLQAW